MSAFTIAAKPPLATQSCPTGLDQFTGSYIKPNARGHIASADINANGWYVALTPGQIAIATNIAKRGDPTGSLTEDLLFDASFLPDPNSADPEAQDPNCARYKDIKYGGTKGIDVAIIDGYTAQGNAAFNPSIPTPVVYECKQWAKVHTPLSRMMVDYSAIQFDK